MRNLQSLSSLSVAVLPFFFGATAFPVFTTTTMKTVSAFSLQQQQEQSLRRRSRSHPSRSWMAAAAMDPVPPLQQASTTTTAVPSRVADLPPSPSAAATAFVTPGPESSNPALVVAPRNKSLRHALVCYGVTRKCV